MKFVSIISTLLLSSICYARAVPAPQGPTHTGGGASDLLHQFEVIISMTTDFKRDIAQVVAQPDLASKIIPFYTNYITSQAGNVYTAATTLKSSGVVLDAYSVQRINDQFKTLYDANEGFLTSFDDIVKGQITESFRISINAELTKANGLADYAAQIRKFTPVIASITGDYSNISQLSSKTEAHIAKVLKEYRA